MTSAFRLGTRTGQSGISDRSSCDPGSRWTGLRSSDGTQEGTRSVLACSFCGKSQADVAQMIDGENGAICDECVRLANDILDDVAISSGW